MKHSLPLTGLILLAAATLPARNARAIVTLSAGPPYAVTVTSNDQLATGSGIDSMDLAGTLPYIDTLTAANGDAWASVDIHMSQGAFSFDVDLQSAGNPAGGDGSNNFVANLRFTVDTPTLYTITGAFSSSQTVGNGSASIFASLRNGGDLLFSDQQENVAEAEGFSIDVDGSPGGDNVNTFTGSLTGTLLPGADYFLGFSMANAMAQTLESGADASGSLSITFVPEPSRGLLGALGVGAVLLGRRRS